MLTCHTVAICLLQGKPMESYLALAGCHGLTLLYIDNLRIVPITELDPQSSLIEPDLYCRVHFIHAAKIENSCLLSLQYV